MAGRPQGGQVDILISNDTPSCRRPFSNEPFSLAARQGNDQFADIVRWTLYAMIGAEEYGITSGNVDEKPGATIATWVTPPKIPRGLNAWTKAGFLHVPPIR